VVDWERVTRSGRTHADPSTAAVARRSGSGLNAVEDAGAGEDSGRGLRNEGNQ
jgi:hypothetical protein